MSDYGEMTDQNLYAIALVLDRIAVALENINERLTKNSSNDCFDVTTRDVAGR